MKHFYKKLIFIIFIELLNYGVNFGSAMTSIFAIDADKPAVVIEQDIPAARQAFSEEFPFIVTTVFKDNSLEKPLYTNTGYGCIGIIINRRTVLTSGVTPTVYSDPKYQLGVIADGNLICYVDVNQDSVIPVDNVKMNQHYEVIQSQKHGMTWYVEWNLALLILKVDIEFKQNIQPVKFPFQPLSVGDKTVIIADIWRYKNLTVSSELSLIDQFMVQNKTDDYTWKQKVVGTLFSGEGSAVFSLSNYPLIANGTLVGYGQTSYYPNDRDWLNGIIVYIESTYAKKWILKNSFV